MIFHRLSEAVMHMMNNSVEKKMTFCAFYYINWFNAVFSKQVSIFLQTYCNTIWLIFELPWDPLHQLPRTART